MWVRDEVVVGGLVRGVRGSERGHKNMLFGGVYTVYGIPDSDAGYA